ncbi:MAG: metal ABC transporter permease [Candidatus Omnitrophica bacterium]|nr:metal ABC transporter permease [Candidatus Omnitrophota bacterium]
MPDLLDALRYSFMQRAVIAGSFIALSCAVLGVFLVLKRFSLIGDGLAHISFATIALGLLLKVSPIYLSLPFVVGASLLILKLVEKTVVYGDAAIGLLSAVGVATGVMIASLSGGFNVDLFSYLFGNILAVSPAEVFMSIGLSAAVLGVITVLYRQLVAVTFDEEYARVSGIRTTRVNRILLMLSALTVVLGIKVVGTLLVSSLIIFPAITALQIARSFKTALLFAGLCAVASVWCGVALAYQLNVPAGAAIVQVNFLFFTAVYAGSRIAGARSRARRIQAGRAGQSPGDNEE